MRNITTSTKAGDHEYSVTYREFESLDEVLATVDGGADSVLGIVNSAQRQNALQGAKAEVLKAFNALQVAQQTGDENTVAEAEAALAEAEEKHRESALGYTIGKPRSGASGGVTKKTQATLGERITAYVQEHGKPPSQAQMSEIMKELGIG